MTLLLLGVALWSAAHWLPCSGSATRAALIARLGLPAYKGIFSLTLLLSIALMVMGWRASAPVALYSPPSWTVLVADLLVLVALVLFVASGVPTNLKRLVRHPQLTGVAIWAGAHLLANGDRRSLALFGGLGLWALASILLLNRRDGAWTKPPAQPITAELKPLVAAGIGFAVLFYAHVYLFGVSPMPR